MIADDNPLDSDYTVTVKESELGSDRPHIAAEGSHIGKNGNTYADFLQYRSGYYSNGTVLVKISPKNSEELQALYKAGNEEALHEYLGQGDIFTNMVTSGDYRDGLETGNNWQNYTNDKWNYEIVYTAPPSGYDTGGYTGDWGPEGKLAVLHEKEIVLNKYDTQNILQAVETVRSISDLIQQKAALSALGMIGYGNFNMPMMGMDNTPYQEVKIYADFPNAVNYNEIELALTNLANRASQYINRK